MRKTKSRERIRILSLVVVLLLLPTMMFAIPESGKKVTLNLESVTVKDFFDANRSVYTWDGNVNEFTRTTADAVKNAITTGFKPDSCPFQNLGEEFGKWLEEVDAFSTDQLGNPRDKNAMWPGAYQK